MLDLGTPTRVAAGIDLAGDDQDPFVFYVFPPRPQIALDGTRPRFNLLRVVDGGKVVGGHLRIVTELAHTEAALEAAREELKQTLRDEHDRVRLRSLEVHAATAELVFVGTETNREGGITPLLQRSYGLFTPKLDAPYTATFSVYPSPEGVSLIEAAMRSGGAPIGVIYRLEVEGLRAGLSVVAHVDWARVYEHLSTETKEGYLFTLEDIQRISEKLVESKVVTIQVVQAVVPQEGGPPPPDTAAVLAWIQREIVEKCCEPALPLSRDPARASLGTLGDMFGVGAAFAIKPLIQSERIVADIHFEERTIVKRTLALASPLLDLLGTASPDDHVSDASLHNEFFDRVSLHLTTARPLVDTFVQEVVAHFDYGQMDIPIRLAAGVVEGNASTWAGQAADRTWSLPLDVTLANDAPVDPGAAVHIAALSGQSRELTLDLERLLGLVRVEVAGAPDNRVLATRVTLVQLRGTEQRGDPREVTLTPTGGNQVAWFRDVQPGDRLVAATKHLLKDGRLVDVAPVDVETRLFRLPPAFPGSMTVQLFADTDWSGLERVIVTLQKSADAPTGTVELASAGASTAVSLDLPDPTDRSYRYRVTRMLSDDTEQDDDWQTTDRAVLLVGRTAADVLVVDVTPLGLELPAAGISLIEVELQYLDPTHQIRDTPTAVIHARADTYHWVVPLKDPTRRSYQYRIIVHRTSGATETGPWTTSSDRIVPVPITKA